MQPTYEEFLEACRTGDLDTVERALAGLNIHSMSDGFMSAVRRGKLNVVNRLLEIPEFVEVAPYFSFALQFAAMHGHLNVVNRLLKIPSLVNYAHDALVAAAGIGHIDVVKCLLEIPLDFNSQGILYNLHLALKHAASVKNNFHVVDCLLEIPEVYKLFQENYSVLKSAVESNDIDMVNYLLERGSAVLGDEPNKLILLAIEKGNHNIAIRLLQEKLIAEELMADRSPIEEHKDFFKEIDKRGATRFVAAQCLYLNSVDEHAVEKLSSNEHNEAIHTRPIENQILTYLYHDVLCGKSACLEREKEDSFFKCPVISQFRDDAIGAKARAQAKLGTQATTSSATNSSTNSSTQPSKKARTS